MFHALILIVKMLHSEITQEVMDDRKDILRQM
jgi:hypothetical protein